MKIFEVSLYQGKLNIEKLGDDSEWFKQDKKRAESEDKE